MHILILFNWPNDVLYGIFWPAGQDSVQEQVLRLVFHVSLVSFNLNIYIACFLFYIFEEYSETEVFHTNKWLFEWLVVKKTNLKENLNIREMSVKILPDILERYSK